MARGCCVVVLVWLTVVVVRLCWRLVMWMLPGELALVFSGLGVVVIRCGFGWGLIALMAGWWVDLVVNL